MVCSFGLLIQEYTLIRVSWAASESLLKLPLYDFNDFDDWTIPTGDQLEQRAIILILHNNLSISYNRKTTVIQLKM